ncbi:hypothetical protein [Aquipuribacter sp. SD81]|uniref:hypothetical protein n=1 Tax=Aquipuribacter sp. SD81 TaxID=3127703 RepID=UPI00301708E7
MSERDELDPADDGDMTDRDPVSSSAEGDADPGSAALDEAGSGHAGQDTDRAVEGRPEHPEGVGGEPFAAHGPPPEAADDEPVTDAAPVDD